jgi:hypothetical protein
VEELSEWIFSALQQNSQQNFPAINPKSRKQMKDVELVALLLLFLEEGVKSYRQEDLDQAFSDRDSNWDEKAEIENEFKQVIQLIKQLLETSLPDINLSKTRLKNQTDFYSMFAAISELHRENSLEISTEVSKRIEQFLKLVDSAERSKNQEAQNYYDAITTSPLYSGVEKTKARIEILKSVIKRNIDL